MPDPRIQSLARIPPPPPHGRRGQGAEGFSKILATSVVIQAAQAGVQVPAAVDVFTPSLDHYPPDLVDRLIASVTTTAPLPWYQCPPPPRRR